jgi:hypothetical protein
LQPEVNSTCCRRDLLLALCFLPEHVQEAGVVAPTDIKEVQQHASRRTSGIANMFFRQRESMDTGVSKRHWVQ